MKIGKSLGELENRRDLILGLSLSVLTLLTFSAGLFATFLWDDEQFILKNLYLQSWGTVPKFFIENLVAGAGLISNLYRPIQLCTHFVDWRLWGTEAWGHHLTSLLLYAALACTLYSLLLTLLKQETSRISVSIAAFLAAALYLLHPLQSEAVIYISGRGDVLALLFMSLGALCLRWNPLIPLGFGILAILSKESAVLNAPLLYLLVDWIQTEDLTKIRWKNHISLWVVAGIYVLLRLTVLNFSNFFNFYGTSNVLTENFSYRVYTYLSTLPKGLSLWFWPTDIHHERSWKVYTEFLVTPVWQGAVFVVLILGAAWIFWKKKLKLSAAGSVWFLASTLPTSNLIVMINALFYDHWMIVPGLGLCFISAELFVVFLRKRGAKVLIPICCVAIAPLLIETVRQNKVWSEPISLYSHILSYEPRSAKMLNNLAMYLEVQGDVEKAKEYYLRAISINDQYPQTHHNLGMLYSRLGQNVQAIAEFQKALQIDPRFFHSKTEIGKIYISKGDWHQAISILEESIRILPTPEAYLELIECYERKGDMARVNTLKQEAKIKFPN